MRIKCLKTKKQSAHCDHRLFTAVVTLRVLFLAQTMTYMVGDAVCRHVSAPLTHETFSSDADSVIVSFGKY